MAASMSLTTQRLLGRGTPSHPTPFCTPCCCHRWYQTRDWFPLARPFSIISKPNYIPGVLTWIPTSSMSANVSLSLKANICVKTSQLYLHGSVFTFCHSFPDILAAEAPELLGDDTTNLLGDVEADLLDLDSIGPSSSQAYSLATNLSTTPVSSVGNGLDLLGDSNYSIPVISVPQSNSRGTVLSSSYQAVESSGGAQRGAAAAGAAPTRGVDSDDLLGGGASSFQHRNGGPALGSGATSQPQLQLNAQVGNGNSGFVRSGCYTTLDHNQ